jgi:copper chaperone
MLKLRVPDMSCGHCARTIEKAVKSIDPKAQVKVDLGQKTVIVETTAPEQNISEAVRSVGYEHEKLAA